MSAPSGGALTAKVEDPNMHDALPVRKQFDICAPSASQLELRLHWFGRALEIRRGHIVHVERQRSGAGQHVASVAYEVPVHHARSTRRLGGRRGVGTIA
jgi:hypothetical protein